MLIRSSTVNSLKQDLLKMKAVSLRITELFIQVHTSDCSLTQVCKRHWCKLKQPLTITKGFAWLVATATDF